MQVGMFITFRQPLLLALNVISGFDIQGRQGKKRDRDFVAPESNMQAI